MGLATTSRGARAPPVCSCSGRVIGGSSPLGRPALPAQRARRGAACRASKDDDSMDPMPGLDPSLERAVPSEQRPVNELKSLKQANLYSWATLEFDQYVQRLALVFIFFGGFVGGPIAYQSFDPTKYPVEFVLASCTGALLVVAATVIRIYLGWAYINDRLMSAAVPYEETGWYVYHCLSKAALRRSDGCLYNRWLVGGKNSQRTEKSSLTLTSLPARLIN